MCPPVSSQLRETFDAFESCEGARGPAAAARPLSADRWRTHNALTTHAPPSCVAAWRRAV